MAKYTLKQLRKETKTKRSNGFTPFFEHETYRIEGFKYIRHYELNVQRTDNKGNVSELGDAKTKQDFLRVVQEDLRNI